MIANCKLKAIRMKTNQSKKTKRQNSNRPIQWKPKPPGPDLLCWSLAALSAPTCMGNVALYDPGDHLAFTIEIVVFESHVYNLESLGQQLSKFVPWPCQEAFHEPI